MIPVYPRVCGGTTPDPFTNDGERSVYPRVCGGTYLLRSKFHLDIGLSPRVRGNLSDLAVDNAPPVRMGLSPRVRGNRTSWAEVYHAGRRLKPQCSTMGLSPRVRGNPSYFDGRRTLHPSRVYPRVCGGTAYDCPRLQIHMSVYPRVCGGTVDSSPTSAYPAGLSPRVRGNRPSSSARPRAARSIPACAGEPPLCFLYPPYREVYPRVCGGTGPVSHCYVWLIPSRPKRSIPACAGEPRPIANTIPCCPIRGLSPRVRGNPRNTAAKYRRLDHGSIPACAGEPSVSDNQFARNAVYPRVCGGTSRVNAPWLGRAQGLSPRVRGNRGF